MPIVTTIAYKDGVLACDKQAVDDGSKVKATGKLIVTKTHAYAVTGHYAYGLAFIRAGLDLDERELEKADVVAMDLRTGKAVVYEPPGTPIPIEERMYAKGSGAQLALGALAMGASPANAVRIASRYDPDTGMGVQVVHSDRAIKRAVRRQRS